MSWTIHYLDPTTGMPQTYNHGASAVPVTYQDNYAVEYTLPGPVVVAVTQLEWSSPTAAPSDVDLTRGGTDSLLALDTELLLAPADAPAPTWTAGSGGAVTLAFAQPAAGAEHHYTYSPQSCFTRKILAPLKIKIVIKRPVVFVQTAS